MATIRLTYAAADIPGSPRVRVHYAQMAAPDLPRIRLHHAGVTTGPAGTALLRLHHADMTAPAAPDSLPASGVLQLISGSWHNLELRQLVSGVWQ